MKYLDIMSSFIGVSRDLVLLYRSDKLRFRSSNTGHDFCEWLETLPDVTSLQIQ